MIRSPDVTVLERVFPIKRVYVYIHVYIYRVETGIDSSTSSLGDEIDTISAVFSHGMERGNIFRYPFCLSTILFLKNSA